MPHFGARVLGHSSVKVKSEVKSSCDDRHLTSGYEEISAKPLILSSNNNFGLRVTKMESISRISSMLETGMYSLN